MANLMPMQSALLVLRQLASGASETRLCLSIQDVVTAPIDFWFSNALRRSHLDAQANRQVVTGRHGRSSAYHRHASAQSW